MVLQCSNQGDRGSFSEMTIEIGSIRSILEEEVRNRTKFENRRVLVPVDFKYKKKCVEDNFSHSSSPMTTVQSSVQ